MGTRADFYVGRGKEAEWLGSIAWDGHPGSIPDDIRVADTERQYRDAVFRFLSQREDATRPEEGWPWPWDDSRTTDYAYAFDNGEVYASHYGGAWFVATAEERDEEGPRTAVFPNMKDRKNIQWGEKSGLIVLSRK